MAGRRPGRTAFGTGRLAGGGRASTSICPTVFQPSSDSGRSRAAAAHNPGQPDQGRRRVRPADREIQVVAHPFRCGQERAPDREARSPRRAGNGAPPKSTAWVSDHIREGIVHEHRDDRIEPDALPVPAGQQAGADPGVVLVIHHDAGPVQADRARPPSRASAEICLPSSGTAEQLGTGHFEPRVGENRPPGPVFTLRAVVVLEQRGMGVVITQKSVGHSFGRRRISSASWGNQIGSSPQPIVRPSPVCA